jgi:hypothetical protein
MYPNSALSAWQLALMAVVPVAALVVWLTAIFLAAREPRGRAQGVVASRTGAAVAGTAPMPAAAAGEGEPKQSADDRVAA